MSRPPNKILFLVNSLEPGRDGVGDVTRLLAGYLEQQQIDCTLISLGDPHLTEEESERVTELPGSPRLVRISSRLSWKERTVGIRGWVNRLQPDLISLQFVAYALQVKGIVYSVIPSLQRITNGYPLHVMFHELWVGAEEGASLKHRLIGGVQRLAIQKCLQRLKPGWVHASNPTYVSLLQQAGIPSSRLPIASGIPIVDSSPQWIFSECQKGGIPLHGENRQEYWLFGHFGTLHPEWPPEPLFSNLLEAGMRKGKRPVFIGIGRLGHGQTLWDRIVRDYGHRLPIIHLGIRGDHEVSQFFQTIDYGVSATPWQIIGKSSVAVAMLEHGLPVIVNRELPYPLEASEQDPGEQGLIRMRDELVDRLVNGIEKRPIRSRLPGIAETFLRDNHLLNRP